eukprot:TRINITY_DN8878_c0_g1_i3.p2 TRINITY_DN8878_c0_g1~~TRINITY_DN8878_c0_g1_i3.p2  ORF type:complete len:104 (+),score=20.58 TRINITY_DN8878_c0_g1_i3:200-511(+)
MLPALSGYELERITGISVGQEEFQQAIKLAVPEGHTVKAYPVQFTHTSAQRMMNALQIEKVPVDLLNTRGDQVRFGLRVRVFPYPDNICAVWVMIAVKYKSVS